MKRILWTAWLVYLLAFLLIVQPACVAAALIGHAYAPGWVWYLSGVEAICDLALIPSALQRVRRLWWEHHWTILRRREWEVYSDGE